MKIHLKKLLVRTRRTVEQIDFSDSVTFLHGPVSTGKSTIARLIDYCFGGELERTPAIQLEFVAVELSLKLGGYDCTIERAANDNQRVRVTWNGIDNNIGSVNAPLVAQSESLLDAEVYSLSDLIFYLCGITPIKVRQRSRDPESPLIRLSFRDIWWYCYLDQAHLDSSFFRLEDPFRGRKSQDAMKFFTGLHSERLSQLETELMQIIDEQRTKREAVLQIRSFISRFELGSELDMAGQLQETELALNMAKTERARLEITRYSETHPTDELRSTLRRLSSDIESISLAIAESTESIEEQRALRAEFITTKTKAERVTQAWEILEGVHCQRCPDCGADVLGRPQMEDQCRLCGSPKVDNRITSSLDQEVARRDLNERIDQIADSIARRERELNRMKKQLVKAKTLKESLDAQLQEELARYDSAFVENIRAIEGEIATLSERIRSLQRLQQMPHAINALEEEAGALQGRIDRSRRNLAEERDRLHNADENIIAIAREFKRIMLAISFPGVSEQDHVLIDPRNWKPAVVHGDQDWTFWDTGSGGKKTLFNVCYALAIHLVARGRGLPVPTLLIMDSPTKNISEDENPELIQSLYREIYQISRDQDEPKLQFLLIDSDLVHPDPPIQDFSERRMAGEPDAPSLIPYYTGP
ncbi:hypothetical protein [Geothrix edaphica]|uniref:Rad50/SbcC-type AAA domain-containing protein n=1 Tax=Geothrix edaphica TaxID=2927976 RepID=A0ABQ5PUA4_9BACT|nr:hypothetical protein [Geothrix edaphica]GLH65721.1 hypothetical protein GETHED_00850 [Geothrix edaphica]